MRRDYPQQQPMPYNPQWLEVDPRRRYGTPQEPTIHGRTASLLSGVYAGLAITMIFAGVGMFGYTLTQWLGGRFSQWALLTLGVVVVFLIAAGYSIWRRHTLEEWAIQHDVLKWDELEEEVEDLRLQVSTLQAGHDKEMRERDDQYARLDAEYRQAVITINSLRTQLAGGARHKNASFIPKETPTQMAIRAIADAYRNARPYTRQAICADGSISQESWRDAMDLLHRNRLAVQERKGSPWRITAATADVVLAAANIVPSGHALEDEQ